MKVKDAMHHGVICIGSDATISEIAECMRDAGVRAIPIQQGRQLVGIVTDRDVNLTESLLVDEPPRATPVSVTEAMTEVVFTCGPNAHLHAVASEMAQDKHGSAVVVDPEHPLKILGVFTTSDALRALSQFAPQE